MDEYIGLAPDAPQSFGHFIRRQLLDRVGVGQAYFINGQAPVPDECAHYATLLQQAPIDIVCMGIGENGHVAFNDPPVADFHDRLAVKAVELDERCRIQQVNDGCFPTFDDVPRHAITLTVPMLMSGTTLSVVVPAASKADAVKATVLGPVETSCPASILRRHPDATLFLDLDSARGLSPLPAVV
jgi:glucosamine-6-phosphate deaminase